MSDLNILEILLAFEKFINLMENPNVCEGITLETAKKAFECSYFVECAIRKVREQEKETAFESHLRDYLHQKKRFASFVCSDFETACDKLLEMCLKSIVVPSEAVDILLQLYTQKCGTDRLNKFLERTIIASTCTNIILESLEDIGVDFSKLEEEALIMSWETTIEAGHTAEISDKITEMVDNGHASKLIEFHVKNLNMESKVRKLIAQILSVRVNKNDEMVCLAFIDVDRKLFFKYLEDNDNFDIDFMDAIFYFGRNMKKIEDEWVFNSNFRYKHLIKSIKLLLSGPSKLYRTTSARLEIAKTQYNNTLWDEVVKDCKK